MNTAEVLGLIAEMKSKADTPQERQYYDGMALCLITQEQEPLRMAMNLDIWIGRNWMTRTPPEVMEKLASL